MRIVNIDTKRHIKLPIVFLFFAHPDNIISFEFTKMITDIIYYKRKIEFDVGILNDCTTDCRQTCTS